MSKLIKKTLNFIKHIIFERGYLIYFFNIPSFKKSLKEIDRKPRKEKLNLIFLCQCPTAWTTAQPMYEDALKDDRINVTVVLVPELEFSCYIFLKHIYYEKVYEFGKEISERCIHAYSPETKEWLDLRTLDPDYVFIPRPYETYLPKEYRASAIRKYAKVCYVPYAFPMLPDSHIIYNSHFSRNVYFFFCEQEQSYEYLCRKFHRTCSKGIQKAMFTGYPRFDLIDLHLHHEGKLWKRERSEDNFRIIWTPRWTTDPKLGGSNFFHYKDKILEYARTHKNVELLFRPHPMAFENYVAQGLMSSEDVEAYSRQYAELSNAVLDQTVNYYDTFFSSDVLISDPSSVTLDYLFTGKPIIYCPSSLKAYEVNEDLMECYYVAETFEEVIKMVDQLQNGDDPKRKIRDQMVKKLKRDGKIGQDIIKYIKDDYWK